MDLKRLKHLVALADYGHFGRAAAQCHLSQSAFSRSIQALEDELGLPLFVRGPHEVRCTPAGEFVLARARRLVFDSRCMTRDVELYRGGLVGELAMGVGPYPAATLVPRLLTDLSARFPQACVRVEVAHVSELQARLEAEALDFYLADLQQVPAATGVVLTSLGLLQAGLFVRAGHPLAGAQPLAGAAVLAHGLACVRLDMSLRLAFAPLFGLPAGTPLPLALACDDVNLLKAVALTTDRVLVCPVDSAQVEVTGGSLVPIEVRGLPVLGSNLGMVALSGRGLSPLARHALDWLMAAAPRPG